MKNEKHKKQWEFLKNKFEANQLSHAYLFTGAEGLGKKDFAKEFVDFMGCKFPDLMVIKPEDGGIEIAKVREIQNFLSYKPYYGAFKAVVVENAHSMNHEAQSCFLKTLEEPKGNTLIILVTSKQEMLLQTIFSRCQTVKFFGKPEVAEEKSKAEKEILRDLLKATAGTLSEKFKYTKSLDFEKRNLAFMLEALQRHFRNELLAKLEKEGTNSDVLKIKNKLKLIEEISKKLTFSNVNQKLALEVLLMQI